jgi:hypothetical protein
MKTKLPDVKKGFTFKNKTNFDGNSFSKTTTKFMRNGKPEDTTKVNIVAKSGKYALIKKDDDSFSLINAETGVVAHSLTIPDTSNFPVTSLTFDGTSGFITTGEKVYTQVGDLVNTGFKGKGITQYLTVGSDKYLVAEGALYKNNKKIAISAHVNSIFHDGNQLLVATDKGYIPNSDDPTVIVNKVPNQNIKQIIKTSDNHY